MTAEYDPGAEIDRPYFFLSYARTPKVNTREQGDPDRWVTKFYTDLCENILTMTNAPADSVGYMDRNNRLGDRWPDELARALATCRVFVPLYSERYFGSQNCGMEWLAFSRRELNHWAHGKKQTKAIVPVQWTPVAPDLLPDVARPIQYQDTEFEDLYRAEGFFGLIKLNRYQDDYQVAVMRLARRILEVAREANLSTELPADYAGLESAFGLRGSKPHMRISVMALDASTLPKGRTARYYGETPRKWSPYRPDYSLPLADYAAELTGALGCQSTVGTFHELDWTTNGHEALPALCLIDPWVARVPEYREMLRRLDAITEPWISYMVPWSNQDDEMTAEAEELRRVLDESLSRKLRDVPRRCQMAATGIPTFWHFSDLLPRMAMIMLKRFRKEASTYLPPSPSTGRFRLRGPSSDSTEDPDE